MSIEYIEDVEPAAEAVINQLDNATLRAAGLVKVNAWMRSKASSNALRVAASKAKKEKEQKIKQFNIPAPTDDLSRAALKEAAQAMCAGKLSASELISLVRGDAARVSEVMKKGGVKAAILRGVLGF